LILLQDWSSDNVLQRSNGPSELGRDPNLPTNKTLERLLNDSLGLKLEDTYATNLFPFIKKGGLSSRIPFKDLVLAAEEFALPQIRIVAPRLVICLGKNTFNALRVAVAKSEPARGLRRCRDMASAIAEPFDIEYARHRMAIWAQAHTGAWGQSNRNKKNPGCTFKDWVEMSRIVGLKSGN
jgi:restriction system protein